MKYMILIYTDEKVDANATPQDFERVMNDYNTYTEAMQKAGVLLAGEALHPTSAATTVRTQNGKKVTTHGPFAETKEQLGGFYMIECDNLDGAIEWAAKCPGTQTGSVEVRPVMDFSQA